ncbi:cytochrome P450 4B1-like [Ptychodera flava]|uniref:cytochrome P450 4B1-like n=1 Tax=Ptychodera flava TaxID=63121 RepID=UPI00396A5BEB
MTAQTVVSELTRKAGLFLRADVVLVAITVAFTVTALVKMVRLLRQMKEHERVFKDFGAPPAHWFFGHVIAFYGGDEGFDRQAATSTKYNYAYKYWIGAFTCGVNVTHPDSVKVLLATSEPKAAFVYDTLRPWLGDGLLLSNGKKWSRNRRLLTPGFHFDILKPYVSVFSESTKIMLDKWASMDHSKSIEVQNSVSLMTLDTLLKCAFSYKSNCQTANEDLYIKSVYRIAELLELRFQFPPYLIDWLFNHSHHGYQFKKACDFVHNKAKHVIADRRRSLQFEKAGEKALDNKRRYLDFLDILLSTKDEDGNGLTDAEIRDEVDTFMFEGHDTTASGISWILYNLARHPEYQDKCREEIDELMEGKEEKVFEWDDLSKIPYTTMCIKESLRLHPPVPYIARQLTKPMVLPDGRTVPAGHIASVNIFACHHNGNIWPNPGVYDPERFSPENMKDRSPHAFVPFSAGPRNCIGQNFAMNELKVSVAMTIHRFELAVDESKPPSRVCQLVLRSTNGIHLYIKPRKTKFK